MSEKNQRDRFIEAARELGADDDEATFKAKLAQIARQKPKGSSEQFPAGEVGGMTRKRLECNTSEASSTSSNKKQSSRG